MKPITFLSILAFSLSTGTILSAQDVSRAEFEALLARVQMLEQKLSAQDTANQDVDKIASAVVARTSQSQSSPKESGIIEDVIRVIQSREESVTYPWMDEQKWAQIRKGMSSEAVSAILGEPYTNEPSLRKRVDFVFTYRGRRVATNERVEAKVRFYKNVVVDIMKPKL